MRAIRDVSEDELLWTKVARVKRRFELRAGDEVVAALTWRGSTTATGEAACVRYQFQRRGFVKQRILVSRPDVVEQIAVFTPRGSSGTLELADGRRYLWKKPSFWSTERVWTDEMGGELASLRPASWSAKVTVTLTPRAAALPDLPLLALLGQFILVMVSQDAAVATTAAVTSAG